MNSTIHVFAGPSLPKASQCGYPGFVFHGPAVQGDVYRSAQSRPLAIAIIDGYFERVQAVWHKEILWALSEGVHIYGAASMGALRAAELSEFGMVGVGCVFEDFARGRLEDDDEVAIVHGDEASGFRTGSEAMVNIRATLDVARRAALIGIGTHDELIKKAKGTFYPDRNYPDLLAWAKSCIPPSEYSALSRFLRTIDGPVNIKQKDALQLMQELLYFSSRAPAPLEVPWIFQHTDAWETVRRAILSESRSAQGSSNWTDM